MHRLRTLGELRLEGPSGEELAGRRKELVLLAYLAARAPRAVSRGELVDLLWGDRDETRARHSLRQALLELKRVLGPAVEATRGDVRVLPDLETDAATLTALVAGGRHRDAVQAFGGEFLSGCDGLGTEIYRLWLEGERAAIRRQIVWSLENLVADTERRDAWDESVRYSAHWAELCPLDERPHTHHITALHRAGRTGEALARHEALLARLHQESIEPSRSLHRLCDAIERSGRAAAKTVPAPGSAAVFQPALVGRDTALRELRTAWVAVCEGYPALVIVEGEAGMGRTRVCDEFLRRIAATDAAFVLRCRAGNGALDDADHSAARDLLGTLRNAPGLAGAPDRALADVSTIVPALRERFPSLPPPRNGPDSLVESLAHILQDIAAEVPVVLFVDGIASADTASQTLIAALAQRLPQAGVLLLVTAGVEKNVLPDELQDLYSAPGLRRLRLYPLNQDEINALVSSMLACEPKTHRDLVHHLVRESGGNPSLCISAIESLVDSRRLAPDAEGYWRYDAALPVALQETASPTHGAISSRRSPARKRWSAAGALMVVAVFAAAMFAWPREQTALPPAPTLAVGSLRDFTGSDTSLAIALPEMLATNLARLPAVQVISRARMYEILGQLGEAENTTGFADAARFAGATELIEGELYRQPDGMLRMDIRHVALSDGAVRNAESVRGRDLFSLVDQATNRIAASIHRPPASGTLADATTTSPLAYRLYERGLRAYYLGDIAGARQLFRAALSADSTFAMAAYYALRADYRLGVASDNTLQMRLRELADRAPDRERLLIRAYWSSLYNDPAILGVADTLVTRYPSEPDGHLFLGNALSLAGRYAEALPYLRRVIAMDSLSFQNPASHCRACDAVSTTITTLLMLDSFPAAERLARQRVRRQPDSHTARSEYTQLLEFGGRIEEAAASAAHASSFAPGDPYANVIRSMLHIREGRFEDADRTLVQLAASGPANLRSEALWFLSLSLRYQGKLREALDVARAMRSIRSTVREDSSREHTSTHPEAQALFELGRTGEAAGLYERLSIWRGHDVFAALPWMLARNRVWYLTHQATALAAGGDTARLPALIDTLEATGRLSLLGRDRRLHHYARGLLLAARADTAGAAASFYRATYLPVTPVTLFARINLEYGRMLVALGRAEEAVRTLQPALRGPLEAGNFYSTHTEIREMLGRAWEMAGQPDSATVHYRWVLNAWKNADPEFHARRDATRRRLDRLLATD